MIDSHLTILTCTRYGVKGGRFRRPLPIGLLIQKFGGDLEFNSVQECFIICRVPQPKRNGDWNSELEERRAGRFRGSPCRSVTECRKAEGQARPEEHIDRRPEKLLGCVRRGLSNKHACMVAGISETTFYRWIEKGKHAKRGPYREFWDSLQAAHAHFEKFHLKAIARSSLEETQSTREVIEYEGSEVVTLPDGKRQLRPGKVKSVRLEIHTHPPTPKGSAGPTRPASHFRARGAPKPRPWRHPNRTFRLRGMSGGLRLG